MSATIHSGRYRLDRVLGGGGMGQVHLAHDTQLERRVAIKMLPADAAADPQARARLRREAQRIAHDRGCFLLTGQCYEQEGAPPFGPFVEQMEYGARLLPQALRAALGDGAAEIAAMVPSLRRTYADIPTAAVVPPDQERRLLFNAYLEYMRRGSPRSAVVALFDDLHWADD
jgi:serine/threonine protein kinase